MKPNHCCNPHPSVNNFSITIHVDLCTLVKSTVDHAKCRLEIDGMVKSDHCTSEIIDSGVRLPRTFIHIIDDYSPR